MSTQITDLEQADFENGLMARARANGISRAHDDVTSRLLGASGMAVHMLSLYDNKIFLGNVLEEGGLSRRNVLVDMQKLSQKRMLGASGDPAKQDRAHDIDPFSEEFKRMIEVRNKIDIMHERTGVPVSRLLGAAASGTATVPTEYELVRRVNYLAEVKGPAYVMEIYNAINGVTVKPTTDLNVLGFARSAKLTGQTEIGDNQIPDVAKNTYTSYFKDIFSDAFRWEFGMREKKDSVFDLEAQVTQDIAGLFAKIKDAKITTGMNAISDTTPSTNWAALLSTYETHFTSKAGKDIEDADNALQDYGGAYACFMPRAVARTYRENVNVAVGINKDSISLPVSMEKNRSFAMPMNEHITAYVNDSITAATAVLVSRQWAIHLQGPVIQVTYKNQFTPAQMEGRIYFDFNGHKETVAAAGHQIVGLLS